MQCFSEKGGAFSRYIILLLYALLLCTHTTCLWKNISRSNLNDGLFCYSFCDVYKSNISRGDFPRDHLRRMEKPRHPFITIKMLHTRKKTLLNQWCTKGRTVSSAVNEMVLVPSITILSTASPGDSRDPSASWPRIPHVLPF